MGKAGVKNDTVSKCAEVEVDAHKAVDDRECAGVNMVTNEKLGGESGSSALNSDVPTAFKQTEFASTYEARIQQTPAPENKKVMFVNGARGESICILKPPPDAKIKSILDDSGVDGVEYKNGVPNFLPFMKVEVEIDHMVGGKGKFGNKARDLNFQQANTKLANELNNDPELAKKFGMEVGKIKASDVERYRVKNNLTWHELNDTKTMQLVPTEINATFGHLGGVGEINSGAYETKK